MATKLQFGVSRVGSAGLAPVLLLCAGGVYLAACSQPAAAPARLATQLEPGMELVYASGGSPQPPWSIDSISRDVQLVPGSECAVIYLRRRPDQPHADENRLCLGADTLYQWDVRDSAWTIIRPVGPSMVWAVKRANGDTVRYETGALSEESISGRMIPVVHTTVTTMDSLGRPKRRLRERYAVTLATATGGVFESPDSSDAARWVAASVFELHEIRVR